MLIKFCAAYDDVPRYALTVSPVPPPAKKPLTKVKYGGRINSSTRDASRAGDFDQKTIDAVKTYYASVEPSHDIRNLEFLEFIAADAAGKAA